MVDTLNHHWLAALSNPMALPPLAEKLMRIKRQNRSSEADGKWGWISRNQSRLRSRQNFFLDIPFYRTQ